MSTSLNFLLTNKSNDVRISQDSLKNFTTREKILSFAQYKDKWSFGEGVSFNDNVVDLAIKFYEKVMDSACYRNDAFPGLEGEIIIKIYENDDIGEFCIKPNGLIDFVHEYQDEDRAHVQDMSIDVAIAKMKEFRLETSCLGKTKNLSPFESATDSVFFNYNECTISYA
jgi:hypothetical protein